MGFKKIYVSGKVSGTDDYIERFDKAETELKKKFPDAEVFNPVREILVSGTNLNDWKSCMIFCLAHEAFCDAIFLIDGWEESEGAKREYQYAVNNKFTIMSEIGTWEV